jgi:ABC-type lipoprotein export system ATPase subunit
MVTHDESLGKYATRVIRLDSGKIISDEKVSN